jgi:hypothetical protein
LCAVPSVSLCETKQDIIERSYNTIIVGLQNEGIIRISMNHEKSFGVIYIEPLVYRSMEYRQKLTMCFLVAEKHHLNRVHIQYYGKENSISFFLATYDKSENYFDVKD